jgi:hypothetical protein
VCTALLVRARETLQTLEPSSISCSFPCSHCHTMLRMQLPLEPVVKVVCPRCATVMRVSPKQLLQPPSLQPPPPQLPLSQGVEMAEKRETAPATEPLEPPKRAPLGLMVGCNSSNPVTQPLSSSSPAISAQSSTSGAATTAQPAPPVSFSASSLAHTLPAETAVTSPPIAQRQVVPPVAPPVALSAVSASSGGVAGGGVAFDTVGGEAYGEDSLSLEADGTYSDSLAPSLGGTADSAKVALLALRAAAQKQLRARQKQGDADLASKCCTLQSCVDELETRSIGPASACSFVDELKAALSSEQLSQLWQWLTEAQSATTHTLVRMSFVATSAAPVQSAASDDMALLPRSTPKLSLGSTADLSKQALLARKAETAKRGRERKKQAAADLASKCCRLQSRVEELEIVDELKAALSSEQLSQLWQWLTEAQSATHVLVRIEAGASLAASTAPTHPFDTPILPPDTSRKRSASPHASPRKRSKCSSAQAVPSCPQTSDGC